MAVSVDENSYTAYVREHRSERPGPGSNHFRFSLELRRRLVFHVLNVYIYEHETFEAEELQRFAKAADAAADEKPGDAIEDFDYNTEHWKRGSDGERMWMLRKSAQILTLLAAKPRALALLNAGPRRRPRLELRNHLAAVDLAVRLAMGTPDVAARRGVRSRWLIDAKTLKAAYWDNFREGVDYAIWVAMNAQPNKSAPGGWIDQDLQWCDRWLEAVAKIPSSKLSLVAVKNARRRVDLQAHRSAQ